jgi:hypothetical protein
MEKEDRKQRKARPARSETAPEEGNVPVREKPSDLKDASDILKKQADVAKRAMDYADAHAGDLEED